MRNALLVSLILLCTIQLNAQHLFDLNSSIEYGLEHKPSLQSKALEKQAAEELRQNAYKQLMPEISANASLDHYWQIPVQAFPAELAGGPEGEFIPVRVGTPWNISAGINAEIDLINADKWKDIRIAKIRQQLNEQLYENEEALIRQNITIAYYDAQLAKQQAYFALQNFHVQQDVLKYVKTRFDEGVAEQIEYNRAEVALLNAENQWKLAQKHANNQLLQLKFWIGMPLEESLKLVEENWEANNLLIAFEDIGYLQNHPAFQVRRNQVLLAESQMQQVNVRRLPQLTAYAGYSQLAFRNAFDFFDEDEDWYSTGQVGLRLNVPIFSRGLLAGEVKINRLKLVQAQQELLDFELEKESRYQQLRNDLSHSVESIKNQERQMTLAQENLSIAKVKYERGVYSISDLLDVQAELLQAQRSFLEAYGQYFSAQAEINYLHHK